MNLSKINDYELNNQSIIYRLTNLINGKNYIGMAMYGIHDRLFNKRHGYIEIYNKWKDELDIDPKTDDIFLTIKEAIVIYGLENFELTLEGPPSDKLNEEILIAKYNSIINGYNKTLDGLDIFHTKYKLKAINNGVKEVRVPEALLDEILKLPNVFLGSIKSNHTRSDRFVWMNNGDMNIRVPINLYSEFSSRGFIKTKRTDSSEFRRGITKAHDEFGNIILVPDKESIPYGFTSGSNDSRRSLKGKIAVTDGITTKYINETDLNLPENSEFRIGRIQETNKGRIIVNKEGKEKRIKHEDLKLYKDDGWSEGHSNSFYALASTRMWINNGKETINICRYHYPDYEKKGYKPGILDRNKAPNKGRVAINKNGKTKYVNEDEVYYYIHNEDYSLGAAKNPRLASGSTMGRKAMTDGSITIFVEINEVTKYESKGFRLGMAPRKSKKINN